MNKIYVLLKMASGSYIICEEKEHHYLFIQYVHKPNKYFSSNKGSIFKKTDECIDEVVRTSSTLDIEEFTQICMLEIL